MYRVSVVTDLTDDNVTLYWTILHVSRSPYAVHERVTYPHPLVAANVSTTGISTYVHT